MAEQKINLEQEKKCVYPFWDGVVLKAMAPWGYASAYFSPKDKADPKRIAYDAHIARADSCYLDKPFPNNVIRFTQNVIGGAAGNSPFILGTVFSPSVPAAGGLALANGLFGAASDLGSDENISGASYLHAAGSFAASAAPTFFIGRYASKIARGANGSAVLSKEQEAALTKKLFYGSLATSAAGSFVLGGSKQFCSLSEENRAKNGLTGWGAFQFEEAFYSMGVNSALTLGTSSSSFATARKSAYSNGRAFPVQMPSPGKALSLGGIKGATKLSEENPLLDIQENTTLPMNVKEGGKLEEITIQNLKDLAATDAATLTSHQKDSISALNDFASKLTPDKADVFFGSGNAFPPARILPSFYGGPSQRTAPKLQNQHIPDLNTIVWELPASGLPADNLVSFAHEYAHRIDHRNDLTLKAGTNAPPPTEALKIYAKANATESRNIEKALQFIDSETHIKLNSSRLMSENYADAFYPAYLASLGETAKAREAIQLTRNHRAIPANDTFEYQGSKQTLNLIERIMDHGQQTKITNNDVADMVLVTSWERIVTFGNRTPLKGHPHQEAILSIRNQAAELRHMQNAAQQAYQRLDSRYPHMFDNQNLEPSQLTLILPQGASPSPPPSTPLPPPISQIDFGSKLAFYRSKDASQQEQTRSAESKFNSVYKPS